MIDINARSVGKAQFLEVKIQTFIFDSESNLKFARISCNLRLLFVSSIAVIAQNGFPTTIKKCNALGAITSRLSS